MAGTIENPEHRSVAEAMKTALSSHFPGRKLVVQYLPREDLLAVDEHRIVARKIYCGVSLPFGGEVIWRYGTGPCRPHCHVYDQAVYKVMSERFFAPEFQKAG